MITILRFLVHCTILKYLALSDSATEVKCKELEKLAKGCTFSQILLDYLDLIYVYSLLFKGKYGEIILFRSMKVSKRMKHVDLKYHYVWDTTMERNSGEQGIIFNIGAE